MSYTLHDVQEPQSARPSTARSPRSAIWRTISGAAGLEKICLVSRKRCGSSFAQLLVDPVEELVPASLVDVEQRHVCAAQLREPRRQWLGHPALLVEWADVIHPISLEMISDSIPVHGPKTAEKRPASPPATTNTISSGLVHLQISWSSAALLTSGVVSPQRS